MGTSVSSFRSNIYKMLDNVIETGKPLELDRKGSRVAVVPLGKKSKLDNLVRHDVIVGDPQALLAMNLTAPDIKTALADIEQTPDLLEKALKSKPQDERCLTWEEWKSRRQALREQTNLVGPSVTRRKESSSDSRLRAAFKGKRIP